MKSKGFSWAVRIIAVLALALPFGALAQSPMPEHLGGIINDYTAATGVSGPWEMHGTWSLKIDGGSQSRFLCRHDHGTSRFVDCDEPRSSR
jgi:hypothetical protein